jgi:hypothetical protein
MPRTCPAKTSGVPFSPGQRCLGGEPDLARQVVGSLDGALGAVLGPGGHLLDDVLDEHVEEQRPLARLADLDHPGLRGLVFGIGDVVLADDLMDAVKDSGHNGGDPFGRCGGDVSPGQAGFERLAS